MKERNSVIKKVIIIASLGIFLSTLLIVFESIYGNNNLKVELFSLILIIIIIFLTFYFICLTFRRYNEIIEKENIKKLDELLPVKKWIQVVPLTGRHKEFIFNLLNIAKFYAYRETNESEIKVYIKFDDIEFECVYSVTSKEAFFYNYKVF